MSETNQINFHFLCPTFEINQRKIKLWIGKIILENKHKTGTINLIFCNDDYLLDLNIKYLAHDYYTDIITFQYHDNPIEGDLYISIDRVKENASQLKIDYEIELLRVIIHGIFHLLGFQDKDEIQSSKMRHLEDVALKKYHQDFMNEVHYYDQVYDVVRLIPAGRVSSYGAISNFLSLGSARMVGWALNQLKGTETDIPSFRVVNARGELTGRLSFTNGRDMEQLLKQEGTLVVDNKVVDFETKHWNPSFDL